MTLAGQIAALKTMSTADLAAEFERLLGKAPRYRQPAWMRKRIAFALQVAVYGGLPSVARAELDRLTAEITLPATTPTAIVDAQPTGGRPRPGALLTREWRGQQIRVVVTSDGFEWDGRTFSSLSAVAFAITGARWSGHLFFGLRGRSKK
jgi:hypothetical protein